MNRIFLSLVLGMAWGCLNTSYAQEMKTAEDFGVDVSNFLDNTEVQAIEEQLKNVETPVDTTVNAEHPIVSESVITESEPALQDLIPEEQNETEALNDVSYYISKLKLNPEQLEEAQKISENGRLFREQILHSLELLQKQINTLEDKNLKEFEKILTDEQKMMFDELKSAYEAEFSQ